MDVDLEPAEDYSDWNDPRYPNFSPWKFIKAAVGLQLAGTYALSKLSNSDYMSGPFTENLRKRKFDCISDQSDGGVLAQIEKPPTGPTYTKRNKGTQVNFQSGRKIYILRPLVIVVSIGVAVIVAVNFFAEIIEDVFAEDAIDADTNGPPEDISLESPRSVSSFPISFSSSSDFSEDSQTFS